MQKSWRTHRTLRPDFEKQEPVVCPATRFFDQLSYIGDEIVGCFALETSDGIILIDCMNPDQRSIDLIEQGFRDLGLDIHQLKAILITHGHGDHYLQDGELLTFGDTQIKAVFTPGHSIGCFSFIILVTDEGRPHRMALWGGSGILPDSNVEDYYQSLLRFSHICDTLQVDGEIATHPVLDMGLQRLELVRNIVDGVPNPFVLGTEGYHYYEQQFFDKVTAARLRG